MINDYLSIRVQPCSLSGSDALNIFLANSGTLEIPYFFDGGSYLTFTTIMSYLLRYSAGSPELIYPLQFINLQGFA